MPTIQPLGNSSRQFSNSFDDFVTVVALSRTGLWVESRHRVCTGYGSGSRFPDSVNNTKVPDDQP